MFHWYQAGGKFSTILKNIVTDDFLGSFKMSESWHCHYLLILFEILNKNILNLSFKIGAFGISTRNQQG